jgi:hypothetical protein
MIFLVAVVLAWGLTWPVNKLLVLILGAGSPSAPPSRLPP